MTYNERFYVLIFTDLRDNGSKKRTIVNDFSKEIKITVIDTYMRDKSNSKTISRASCGQYAKPYGFINVKRWISSIHERKSLFNRELTPRR